MPEKIRKDDLDSGGFMREDMKRKALKPLKVLGAICISCIFLYFAFKGIDFVKFYELVMNADFLYIFVSLLAVLFAQVLRSYRWGVMLAPIEPVSQKFLFPISSIGYMFVVLLPARLGELSRPYILGQNTGVKISTAMATIVLERILDLVFILTLFGVTVSFLKMPDWIVRGAVSILAIMICVTGALLLSSSSRVKQKMVRLSRLVFPEKISRLAEPSLERFHQGLSVLGSGRHALMIILLTAIIWGLFVLCNLLLFKAFQIKLGVFGAMSVLALTVLGISVPAGPGFIGNFHFFCVLALSFFGIGRETALGYAIVNHVISVGTIVLLGVLYFSMPGLNPGLNFVKGLPSLRGGLDEESRSLD
jgi:uncharacterized protein (TIRG00374 family)